jgi:hypothetical protein
MGYKGLFIVYDKDGEYLGKYPGWTPDEAIKKAKEVYVNREIGKTKYCGSMEDRK